MITTVMIDYYGIYIVMVYTNTIVYVGNEYGRIGHSVIFTFEVFNILLKRSFFSTSFFNQIWDTDSV